MNSDLEWEIRYAARDLEHLYEQLDAAKHEPARPPEVRVLRPAPGPSTPGNWLWISRATTMEQRLREVAFNAFGDLGIKLRDGDARVSRLLDLIAFNAQLISELAWAGDFLDELTDQARQLGKWLNPPEPTALAKQPEKYVPIETITRNLAARGQQVTNRQAREVAAYNQFDTCKFTDGRNGYKLTEFITHYLQK